MLLCSVRSNAAVLRRVSGDHVSHVDKVVHRNQIDGLTMSLAARLQVASTDYQKLQADLSNAVEARQRLDAQLSENELVKKVRPNLPHLGAPRMRLDCPTRSSPP
jgi:hypothetical protein